MLVAAGTITVFLMPLLGMLTYRVVDSKPLEAVKEIRRNPRNIGSILREHWELERMLARKEALEHLAAQNGKRRADTVSSKDRITRLQRRSARKREIDEVLDFAAKKAARRKLDPLANSTSNASASMQDNQHQKEQRSHIAERAMQEHQRRMGELERTTEAGELKDDDAEQSIGKTQKRSSEDNSSST